MQAPEIVKFNNLLKAQSRNGVIINGDSIVSVYNRTTSTLESVKSLAQVQDYYAFLVTYMPSLVPCFLDTGGSFQMTSRHSLYAYLVACNRADISAQERECARQLALFIGMQSIRQHTLNLYQSLNKATRVLSGTKLTWQNAIAPENGFITSRIMSYLAKPENNKYNCYIYSSAGQILPAFYNNVIRKPFPDKITHSLLIRDLNAYEECFFCPGVFYGDFGNITLDFAKVLGLYQHNQLNMTTPGVRGRKPKCEEMFAERIYPDLIISVQQAIDLFDKIKLENNISDTEAGIYYISPYYMSFYIDKKLTRLFKPLQAVPVCDFAPLLYLRGFFVHPF